MMDFQEVHTALQIVSGFRQIICLVFFNFKTNIYLLSVSIGTIKSAIYFFFLLNPRIVTTILLS